MAACQQPRSSEQPGDMTGGSESCITFEIVLELTNKSMYGAQWQEPCTQEIHPQATLGQRLWPLVGGLAEIKGDYWIIPGAPPARCHVGLVRLCGCSHKHSLLMLHAGCYAHICCSNFKVIHYYWMDRKNFHFKWCLWCLNEHLSIKPWMKMAATKNFGFVYKYFKYLPKHLKKMHNQSLTLKDI